MRDFNKVSGAFWTGETGKELKKLAAAGDHSPQLLALYLLTCPHVHQIGVFYCPKMYMAHETGLTPAQVDSAIEKLTELKFCQYDDSKETVFVRNMVKWQLGVIKPNDNRHKGLIKDVESIQSETLKAKWIEIHGENYGFSKAPCKPLPSPFKGVEKPPILRDREETEREREKEISIKELEEEKPGSGYKPPMRPPTQIEVCNEFTVRGKPNPNENAVQFWNHYQSIGWKKSGTKIEDWRPLVENWICNAGPGAGTQPDGNSATGEGITWFWDEDDNGNPVKKPIAAGATA